MGKIFEAEDVVRPSKKVREALKDLSPSLGKLAEKILVTYSGEEQEKRLTKLLGEKRAKKLLGYKTI